LKNLQKLICSVKDVFHEKLQFNNAKVNNLKQLSTKELEMYTIIAHQKTKSQLACNMPKIIEQISTNSTPKPIRKYCYYILEIYFKFPPRPLSPYIQYCKDMHSSNATRPGNFWSEDFRKAWKEASPRTREKYSQNYKAKLVEFKLIKDSLVRKFRKSRNS
ncbi:MAG: hypothetical protein MHPSP_003275, partial [Paramarteilia canceri]